MKRHLFLFVCALMMGGVAQAGQIQITNMVKTTDGKPLLLNKNEADAFCAKHGMHLPSARELALAASRPCTPGIMGRDWCGGKIKEIKDFPSESVANEEGFFPVRALNVDGKMDIFYYSNWDYERPDGDISENMFWSSSVFGNGPYYVTILNGTFGGFEPQIGGGAVRCVPGPR